MAQFTFTPARFDPRAQRDKSGGGGVQFHFPQADVNSLFNAMEVGARELNWSIGKQVKSASWAVVRSLGTSTKVAKPKRKYAKDKKDEIRRNKLLARNKSAKRGGRETKNVYDPLWVTKNQKTGEILKFRAKGKAQANKHPYVRLGYTGLAKTSFTWGMGALGKRGGAVKGATRNAKNRARRSVVVTSDLKSSNPYVTIKNKLSYITDALKGGPRNIDTAMERAASGLMHQIENQVARKLRTN